MTAIASSPSPDLTDAGADVMRRADLRRARVAGIAYLATAAVIIVLFGFGSEAGLSSSFGLAPSGDDPFFWTVPSRGTAFVVAGICAMLGGVQLARGFKRRGLITVFIVILFAFAFLVWAARGDDFSLVGMLQSTVTRSVPLALGALAGILCERSGVVNIAIEGMMLFAAFAGAFIGSLFGNLWVGLVAGMLAGALLASLHAGLSIKYQVDQIISGTAINIFALGITSYLATRIARENSDLN
jgi:simple sugar transport system permease protein